MKLESSDNPIIAAVRYALCVVGMSTFLLAMPSFAQSSDVEKLTREVQALKEGQSQIRKQLNELKALLQARPAAPAARKVAEDLENAILNVADDPAKGGSDAKVVVMEFSDYQCPYCARHSTEVLPLLESEYVNTGKVRYVFRDFPLERIHREAFMAAQAANCAGEQGKYWEMHDQLFANRKAIEPFNLHAQAIGLHDIPSFEACLASGRYVAEVRNDMTEGRNSGVRSTPTFILGYVDDTAKDSVKGVRIVRGALAFERLKQEIDKLLAAL